MKYLIPIFLLATALASQVAAETSKPSGARVALLLGNWQYDTFELTSAEASLDKVEQGLQVNGFRVTRRENLDQDAMQQTVEDFASSVPTGGVAVVYYFGLAAHVERFGDYHNLLRPVRAKIANDGDFRSRAINLDDLLEFFHENSGASATFVFLDANWRSPIKPDSKKVLGGLRAFDVETRATVMFAEASGKVVPLPGERTASKLATTLALNLSGFDESVPAACEAIAADLTKPWYFCAAATGIGSRPTLPVAEAVGSGKSPGQGYVNSIGMGFRWCPPGSFMMGSDSIDTPYTRDRKPVRVTVSKGFWMGEHEVTQREYSVVARRNVPPGFTDHPNAPFWGANGVKSVTDFCKKLNELERAAKCLPTGWEYVCPTEAEWEYACRAGAKSAYCFGDRIEDLGAYGNFADRTLLVANPDYYWADESSEDGVAEALAPVGSYRPNAWGIRDMHGNVAEIVADHLLPDLPGGTDPLAQAEKDGKTQIRGGAWCSRPLYCESSFRNAAPGRDKHNFVGFRIALKKTK